VEQAGPAGLGAARTEAFVAAFRHAVVDPGEQLRSRLLELANTHLGPAAPVLLKRICTRHGLPFEAISYEHLMWLADAFRSEVAPVTGEQEAEEFAREVRALLPDATPAPEPDKGAEALHIKESNVLRGVRDVARGWLRAQP
jgi:hypothetical protein